MHRENLTTESRSSVDNLILLSSTNIQWLSLVNFVISVFGMCTNTINIMVFKDKSLKDPSYFIMLLFAVNNTLYLFLISFMIFLRCGSVCEGYQRLLVSNVYLLVFVEYLTSSLAMNGIFLELLLSLQRLKMLMNKRTCSLHHNGKRKLLAPVLLFIISLVYYLPVLFMKKIQRGSIGYVLISTEFGKSFASQVIISTLSIIRLCLATWVLFIVNMITVLRFNKYIMYKNSRFTMGSSIRIRSYASPNNASSSDTISSMPLNTSRARSVCSNQANKLLFNKNNVTWLIIVRSFLFSVSTIPYMVYYVYVTIKPESSGEHFSEKTIHAILLIFLPAMYSFDLFVYYFFNRHFRSTLIKLFQRSLNKK